MAEQSRAEQSSNIFIYNNTVKNKASEAITLC